ncbi:hypothetical protein [Pararhizobium sp.]|uniref:hypothetical protein n=1 Tax=Pararhizobium sp. TaxID=1977563 RepID=UPI003D0A13ED
MLISLAIRDVVLIERLGLGFEAGLSVLTGETGAGKSILLDSLGLALGMRAESGLVRPGGERAGVTAAFAVDGDHPAWELLREQELDADKSEPLVLRRSLTVDGRSRAFINDQAVSVGLLRRVGELLVEIHGQFDDRGLMDPAAHRRLLDGFHGDAAVDTVASAHREWQEALEALRTAEAASERDREAETFLRHTLEELAALDAKSGESEPGSPPEKPCSSKRGRWRSCWISPGPAPPSSCISIIRMPIWRCSSIRRDCPFSTRCRASMRRRTG